MYRLKTEKTLTNGVFKVKLSVEEVSSADQALMDKFGEPTVDFGGSFDPGGSFPAFTLPAKIRKIKSQMPQEVSFDSDDDTVAGEAKARANVWTTDVTTRIQAALDTLQTNSDDFTSSTTTELL